MFSKTLILAAGLLGLAQAQSYTPPKANTFGSLYTPEGTHPVVTGESFQVTWSTAGVTSDSATVSLVLCNGNSNNCVNQPNAIASGIPAKAGQYTWAVPCGLAPGQQSTATGYGMLIIVDGTGEFQYSTQFSVVAGSSCGSGSTSSSTTGSSSSVSSTLSSTVSSSTKSPSSSYTSSTTWGSWTVPSNKTSTTAYSTTYVKPTTTIATMVSITSTQAPVTLTPSPAATTTTFRGAATKFGGSAAAVILAAGAAVLAL